MQGINAETLTNVYPSCPTHRASEDIHFSCYLTHPQTFFNNSLHLSEEKRIFAKKETMPTIFIFFGFRFMFYSNDHEPIHVHVIKDGNEAKYNVSPLTQIYNHGFKKHDIALIESIISENEAVIIDRWKEYFNQK